MENSSIRNILFILLLNIVFATNCNSSVQGGLYEKIKSPCKCGTNKITCTTNNWCFNENSTCLSNTCTIESKNTNNCACAVSTYATYCGKGNVCTNIGKCYKICTDNDNLVLEDCKCEINNISFKLCIKNNNNKC